MYLEIERLPERADTLLDREPLFDLFDDAAEPDRLLEFLDPERFGDSSSFSEPEYFLIENVSLDSIPI